MKVTLSLCVALVAASTAHAQILRPEAVNGALLGGIAGAVIGHNSGDLRHNAWKGAAIGAGAGLIAGEMVGNHRAATRDAQVPRPHVRGDGGYIYRDNPAVYAGIGYGHRDYRYGNRSYGYWPRHYGISHRPHGYYGYRPGVSVSYYPDYSYGYGGYDAGYRYPGYGAQGLFWGGLAGAIIGHNSGDLRHNAWRGAAWGAGAGWLLGTIADANRRNVVYEPAAVQSVPAVTSQQPTAQPQQVTIINNYYNAPATPMSGANGLFGRN